MKQHRFVILMYFLTIVTAGLILNRENVVVVLSGNVSFPTVTNERLFNAVTGDGQLMLPRTNAGRACDPFAEISPLIICRECRDVTSEGCPTVRRMTIRQGAHVARPFGRTLHRQIG